MWTEADIPIAKSLIVRCHSISERLDSLEISFRCQKFFENGFKPAKYTLLRLDLDIMDVAPKFEKIANHFSTIISKVS